MIALFTDVDNNLTMSPIQAVYATALGCADKYMDLEVGFQAHRITSNEFGVELTDLFRRSGFTRDLAEEVFDQVPLHPWVDDVLRLPVDVFLISSGPSYYIEKLADAYAIPTSRVLCSRYDFDGDGLLGRCSWPVSASTKAAYVHARQSAYRLTVGVGDSEVHDGPFLSHCDLPIMTRPSDHFFYVASFDCIGCSTESLRVADAVQQGLSDVAELTLWSQGVFKPSQTTIENLEQALDKYDFAIFVLSADDTTTVRNEEAASIRDNVVLEVGLFMGRMGRDRCFMLRPHGEQSRVPSDLLGVQYLDYDPGRADGNWRAAVGPAVTEMRDIIVALGRRSLGI